MSYQTIKRKKRNSTKTKTKTKTKTRTRTKTRRIVGGYTANSRVAVVAFVQNVASQILNNIEPSAEFTGKNVKYFKLTDDKKGLYASVYNSSTMNFAKFKEEAGKMINKRNSVIHPSSIDLVKMAITCKDLILEYGLSETMQFENFIIQSIINKPDPKRRMTRSMHKMLQMYTSDSDDSG